MKFLSLDLETKSYVDSHPEYALQPWRAKTEDVGITSIAIGDAKSVSLITTAYEIKHSNAYIWLWNGVFDIAWLETLDWDTSNIKWLDAMSAAKWTMRSQFTDPPKGKRFSWSLANVAKACLKDWESYDEYIDIKENIEDSETYWRRRNVLDVKATYLLGMGFWDRMTNKQHKGFLIEQEALYPAAVSWLNGYLYDFKAAEKLSSEIEKRKESICAELKVEASVLNSPLQLSQLLYNHWKIPYDISLSKEAKTDQKSVSAQVLTLIMENVEDKRLALVKEYRDIKSRYDKFIKGPRMTKEYLNSDYLHHQLRINSTYTGRCTISSKSKGNKV